MPPKKKPTTRKPTSAKRSYYLRGLGVASALLVIKALRDAGYLEQWSGGDHVMSTDGSSGPVGVAVGALRPKVQQALDPLVGPGLASNIIDIAADLGGISLPPQGPAEPPVLVPLTDGSMIGVPVSAVNEPVVEMEAEKPQKIKFPSARASMKRSRARGRDSGAIDDDQLDRGRDYGIDFDNIRMDL